LHLELVIIAVKDLEFCIYSKPKSKVNFSVAITLSLSPIFAYITQFGFTAGPAFFFTYAKVSSGKMFDYLLLSDDDKT